MTNHPDRIATLLLFYWQTPLHIAVNNNQPGLLTELLKCGATPGKKTSEGETCYHLAVRNNTLDCLALLLKFSPRHTEVNIFNDKGRL